MVEQEEPGEPDLVDQGKLLVEPGPRVALVAVQPAVALLEGSAAHAGELGDGRLGPVGEVRVAVAELLREIELEPLGDLSAPVDGLAVERKAIGDLTRRAQDGLVVPSPLRLGAFERRAVPDRNERVLERRATRHMSVDVTGHHCLDAQGLGEIPEPGVAPHVSPLERALQLDEEAIAPKRLCQARGGVRILHGEPEPRAARQADDPLVQLLEQSLVERRIQRNATRPRIRSSPRMGRRQQPAEVRVSGRALDQQRDMGAVAQSHFRPGDRPHPE